MHYFFLDLLILNREHNLHPFFQISRHPVRASHKHLFISTTIEVENPRMFQEIADNRANGNILADTRDSNLQATDSPDNQVNLYSGCRSTVKRRNNIAVA